MVALRGTLGVTSTDQGHIFDRLSYRTPAAHRCHSKGLQFFFIIFFWTRATDFASKEGLLVVKPELHFWWGHLSGGV